MTAKSPDEKGAAKAKVARKAPKTAKKPKAEKKATSEPGKAKSPAPSKSRPKAKVAEAKKKPETKKTVKAKAKVTPKESATAPKKEQEKAAPTAARKSTAKKGTAKKTPEKARSQHLNKLLALREESKGLKKIKKKTPAKSAAAAAAAAQDAEKAAERAKAEAAAKKRRRKKPPYKKSELKELREMLEEERVNLLKDLRELDDIAESNRQTTHATFSSHQADAASDSSALESTYIQRRLEEERFAQVSEALVRMDEGSYGVCELCVEEPQDLCETCPHIPLERLRAKPFARMCVQLRHLMEKKNRR